MWKQKIFIWGLTQVNKMYFFWAQNIKMIFKMRHTRTCTPNPVYMSAGVSRYQKSSIRIELSWLVLGLFDFYWFVGSPSGWVGGCVGLPYTCTHAHTHAYTYRLPHLWVGVWEGGWVGYIKSLKNKEILT